MQKIKSSKEKTSKSSGNRIVKEKKLRENKYHSNTAEGKQGSGGRPLHTMLLHIDTINININSSTNVYQNYRIVSQYCYIPPKRLVVPFRNKIVSQ